MGLNDELAKKETKIEKTYEAYNQFKDVSTKQGKKVGDFVSKYWEQITSLIMAFILIGVQQLAEANFNPKFFLDPDFWYEYIPYVMAIWIIISSTVNGNKKWQSEVHGVYIKTKDDIQKHVDDNRVNPYIYEGSKIIDRRRKIEAWKSKISGKIDKLRRKSRITSIDNLKDFLNNDDIIIKLKIKVFQKARNKRLRDRFKELFEYLGNEYIEQNFNNLKVKYNRVTETVLASGLKPRFGGLGDSDFQEHNTRELFNEFGVGFIVTSLLTAVIIALDLQQKDASITTWITFGFKALMLYTYYFRASARSKPIFEKTSLKALSERLSMLDEIKRIVLKK